MMSSPGFLIGLALAGIALLLLLVTRLKVNAFIALMLAALAVGAGSGKPLLTIARSFQEGMGATLGGVAAVIGLGAILGKFLAESRGSDVLSQRLIALFGPRHAIWCIMILGLVVGIATWFIVGLMLLLPILQTITRETGRPYVLLALPLLAMLSVMHGLTPPHPGPVVAIEALNADTGMVLVWAFAIGVPTALLAGPLFGRWAIRHTNVEVPAAVERPMPPGHQLPGFGLTLFSILLPVALMLLATAADLTMDEEAPLRRAAAFIGHPTIALLLATVFAAWSLGIHCGFRRSEVLKFSEEAVASVGMALLIVGGGGGFARVLKETGVADAMGGVAAAVQMPPLVYGWLVAAFIRVATGSATVAITAAAGLIAPVLAAHPGTNVELMVIVVGAGSLFLSHLNDGGFWVVKECLGMSVLQTLKTWTVCETIIGAAGLVFALLANSLL